MASCTASVAGWVTSAAYAGTPSPRTTTSASTPSGVFAATNSRSAAMTFAGCWSGTSRKDSFTDADAGTIVFRPGPVYPPWIPLTSAVGRTHTRSRVDQPASPVPARAPPALAESHSASSNGSAA